MAIIYSYPKQTSLQSTDLLISTRFSTEPGVVPKSISFSLETLSDYIRESLSTPTLDDVLGYGNVSTKSATINNLGLTGNITFLYGMSGSFTVNKPLTTSGANLSATFQKETGVVAYLADIPSVTSYGLFAQTKDSAPVVDNNSERSLIGVGEGTLVVPPDSFNVGDSFQVNMMGKISCLSSATLHIRIKTNTGIQLVDTGVMELDTCTDKCWKLDINFTIRNTGGAGEAVIASGGLFSYVKNAGTNFEGVCFNFINDEDFDTTVQNELVITAQWNTASASNSIYSQIFTLNKIY